MFRNKGGKVTKFFEMLKKFLSPKVILSSDFNNNNKKTIIIITL